MTEEAKAPEEKKAGKSKAAVVGMVLPALLAGAGAFGATRLAPARVAPAAPSTPAHLTHLEPPGPTVLLEPFVLSVSDEGKRLHAMKVSLAIELRPGAKEDVFKTFTPRVRDATLTFFRGLTYEEAISPPRMDKVRTELLERYMKIGAHVADRVLITDLVVQ